MNKREYEEKLDNLQKQINELKNVEIEDDEFPQYGDAYWFVIDIGDVVESLWDNDSVDNYRKDFLRIFKTKEECERYLEIQMAFKEESKKSKLDWKDFDQGKYCFYYDYCVEEIVIGTWYSIRYPNAYYFEDEAVLQNLIERFGKEDIKKYYLGIEE